MARSQFMTERNQRLTADDRCAAQGCSNESALALNHSTLIIHLTDLVFVC